LVCGILFLSTREITIMPNNFHEVDESFAAWLDAQDQKDMEAMLEDGYSLLSFEDEQDGRFERGGSNERW
jgi:hypothetical protein